jgi:hypothetical protein
MKLKFFFAALLFQCSLSGQTSNLPVGVQVTPASPGSEVPAIVTATFSARYPNVNPVWGTSGEYYAAGFTDAKNQKTIVILDKFGNLICEDKMADPAMVPDKIKVFYTENYRGDNPAIFSRLNTNGEKHYYGVLNNDTITFDNKGNRTGGKSLNRQQDNGK